MQEDWDNLIILDACRYGAFERNNTIPGALEYRFSRGSMTGEFFEEISRTLNITTQFM
jgi:hypothetical protein